MSQIDRDWSAEDRRHIRLLAILPFVGAVVLAAVASAVIESSAIPFFVLGVVVATVCAYATTFVGIIPVLALFKRFGWKQWHHFALAGYLGVLGPWLLVALVSQGFRNSLHVGSASAASGGLANTIAYLSIPGVIAGFGAVIFRCFSDRPLPSRDDA
jgi:hypothetical protein